MRATFTDQDGKVVAFEVEYEKRADGSSGPPMTVEREGRTLRYLGLADSRIFYGIEEKETK